MKKFRVVESRTVKNVYGKSVCVPYFYIEESNKFLFWTVWNRYIFGYDDVEKAIEFMNALVCQHNFIDRLIYEKESKNN